MQCVLADGTMSAVGLFPPVLESGDPSPGAGQIFMSQPPVFPGMVSATLSSENYMPVISYSKTSASCPQIVHSDQQDCVLVKEEEDQWKQCRFSSQEGAKEAFQCSTTSFPNGNPLVTTSLQTQPVSSLLGLHANKALKVEGSLAMPCSTAVSMAGQPSLVATQAAMQQQALFQSQTVAQSPLNLPIATPFGVMPFPNTLQWNTGLENKLPFGMIALPGASNINLTYPINFSAAQISDSVVRAAVLHNPNLNLTAQGSLEGVAVGAWSGLSGNVTTSAVTVATNSTESSSTQPSGLTHGLDLTNTVNKASAQDMLNSTVSVAGLNFLSTLSTATSSAAPLTAPPNKKKKSKSSGSSPGVQSSPKIPRKHRCQQCEYQTDNRSHLKRHENSVHSEIKPYMCYVCSKEFSRTEKIRAHFQRFHPTVEYDSSLVHRNLLPASPRKCVTSSSVDSVTNFFSSPPVVSMQTQQLAGPDLCSPASVSGPLHRIPSLPQQAPTQIASMPMFPGMPDMHSFTSPQPAAQLTPAPLPAATAVLSSSPAAMPHPSPLAITSPQSHTPANQVPQSGLLSPTSPYSHASPMFHSSPIAQVSSLPSHTSPLPIISPQTPISGHMQPCSQPAILVQAQPQANLLLPSAATSAQVQASSACSLPVCSTAEVSLPPAQPSPSKPVARFKCEQCAYMGKDSWHLRRHMADVHEKIKEFKCPRCTYETSRKHRIISHMKSHGELDCFYCNYKTGDLEPFMAHLKQCTKEHRSTFACTQCKEHFASQKSLINHLEKEHVGYRCEHCLFHTDSLLALEVHKQNHVSAKPHSICPLCNELCSNSEMLQDHLARVHMREVFVGKEMNCSFCSFRTAQTHVLQNHLQMHMAQMSAQPQAGHSPESQGHACPLCYQMLASRTELQAHIKEHDTEFICRMCGNVYSQQEQLDVHRHHCNMKVKPLGSPSKPALEQPGPGEVTTGKKNEESPEDYIRALLDNDGLSSDQALAQGGVIADDGRNRAKTTNPSNTMAGLPQGNLLATCQPSGMQALSLPLDSPGLQQAVTSTAYSTAMLLASPELAAGMVVFPTMAESQAAPEMEGAHGQTPSSQDTAASQLLM